MLTWVSLGSSFLCLFIGVLVFSFNRRGLLNKIFLAATFFGFLYGFTEALMWQSNNYESALFWSKMGSIWPFFAAATLHFALIFTENKWLKNKLFYIVLYLPAILFFAVSFFTHFISAPPIIEYWGYEDHPAGTLIGYLSILWGAPLPLISFFLCYRKFRSTVEKNRRQQRKFVTIGLAVPVFAYLINGALFPIMNVKTPNFGHIAVLFFAVFSSYAILKYGLFTFDAAFATENIVSIMPDSLILADMNGKIFSVNNQLVDFLGYDRKELKNQYLDRLFWEEIQCANLLKELSEKRVITNCELEFKTKFGEKRSVLFSGSVVKSRTGQDVGLTCVIHDITDRKEMEHRLVNAERLASIGELAGMVGHDLRNPLQGIMSAVFLIKTNAASRLTEEDRGDLETIEEAITRSNKIIKDLLDYSRETKLELSQTTPKALVNNVFSTLELPNNIKIQDKTSNNPKIIVDVNKINRVFANLALNAFDSMPNGGTLEIESKNSEGKVIFRFSDTGFGMDEKTLTKLWTPLFTTKAKGMGFGLAICKRFIEAHNGEISVESTLGKGTTILITLPTKPK